MQVENTLEHLAQKILALAGIPVLTALEKDLLKSYLLQMYDQLADRQTISSPALITKEAPASLTGDAEITDSSVQQLLNHPELITEPITGWIGTKEPGDLLSGIDNAAKDLSTDEFVKLQPEPEAPDATISEAEVPTKENVPEEGVFEMPEHTDIPAPQPEQETSVESIPAPEPEILAEIPDKEVAPPAPVAEIKPEPVPEIIPPVITAPPIPTTEPLVQQVNKEEISLNERIFKEQDKKTLADKLMFTPIDNIKPHITLNKKVAFIIGLFNQESDDYNKALDQLNSSENLQDAMNTFHMLRTRYGWKPELELAKELENLVRRRFAQST